MQLFIDCVSIGTFERVFFVLFPRFGILGITGPQCLIVRET
jgi:hypothetical protein